ncbi:MAG: hypothetical protein E2577_07100, partial [Starkeya sp.]|nr:hypothetical protein [Starkeya sp.]
MGDVGGRRRPRRQRGELREVILNYRAGLLPILAPLTLWSFLTASNGHVEADLDGVATVVDVELVHGLFLLGVVG